MASPRCPRCGPTPPCGIQSHESHESTRLRFFPPTRVARALAPAPPSSAHSRSRPPYLQGAGYTPGCAIDHRRNHPVNVHGCGIGWYACEKCGLVDEDGLDAYSRPTVYTTVAAPSHDRNLRALSKSISSSLLFGHVRAAGPGASVHQYNCHPFFKGRYMFMHNGDVSGFSKIRRGLQADLRDDLFDHMSGTTDSELLFLLILNQLPDCHTQQDPTTLQQAVLKAFCRVIRANKGSPNSLNVAFTDGETVIATRYRNSEHEEPPSLYFHLGPMPGEQTWDLNNRDLDLGGFDAMETNPQVHDFVGRVTPGGAYGDGRCQPRHDKFVASQALLVSSEPLTGGKGLDRWQLLPSNSMIVAAPMRPTVGRCTRAALVAKLREQASGGGSRHNLSNSSAPVLEIELKCMKDLCRNALGDDCPSRAAEETRGETRDVAGSLPTPGFFAGGPFRSNSGGKLQAEGGDARSRRQSIDGFGTRSGNPIMGFTPSPLGPTPASPKSPPKEDRGSPVATAGGLSRLNLGGDADSNAATTATVSLNGTERLRQEAHMEVESLISSPSARSKPMGIATGDDPAVKRNSSFTNGSSWEDRGLDNWRSYNPMTGPV